MSEIDIVITLNAGQWDATLGGFRIDALRIPGCRVTRVAVDGKPFAEGEYRVIGDSLHLEPKPTRPVGVKLAVPGDLVQQKELELKDRQERNQATHNKRQLWVGLFLGVLATAAGIVTTYMATAKKSGDAASPVQELRDCRNGLDRVLVLSNRPQTNVETLRSLVSTEIAPCLRALDTATRGSTYEK